MPSSSWSVRLAAVALVCAGCGADPSPSTPDRPDRLSLDIERVAQLGDPGGVAFGFGSVWAADPSGTLLRVDPATGEIVARVRVHNDGLLAAGAGGLWVPDFGDDRVRRIDPATNRVTAVVRTPGAPSHVAADRGEVWVALHHGNRVARIDGETARVTGRFRVARLDLDRGGPQGVTLGTTAAYVGVPVLRQVYAVARTSGETAAPIETTQEPCGGIAASGDHVWVSPGQCGFRLMHLDARRGRQVQELQLADAAVGEPVVDGASVWVSTADGVLHRLDARTGRVLARGRIGRDVTSLAVVAPGVLYAAGENLIRISVARD